MSIEVAKGETYYDYFKSGQDGLAYDCCNIIGLSKKRPTLANSSPIWKAKINGQELSLADMDQAYVKMIMDWTRSPLSNWDYAVEMHQKVLRWLAGKW